MLEVFALLLPIAAASGWFAAARHYQKKSFSRAGSSLDSAYFLGLNYFLNEKPDKAIDVLAECLALDHDSIEPHVVLGNLYRRKGEVERAISIHQQLLENPAMTLRQRGSISFELAMDFMRAGLFDRAETLFLEILDDDPNHVQALQKLLDIYQHEKEWLQSIQIAERLAELSPLHWREQVGHFYCELAEEAKAAADFSNVGRFLDLALTVDDRCVRASLAKSALLASQQQYEAAIMTLKKIEEQNSSFVSEIVGPFLIYSSYSLKPSQQLDYLRYLYKTYPIGGTVETISALLKYECGSEGAIEFVAETVHEQPSVRGVEQLLCLYAEHFEGDCRAAMETLKLAYSNLPLDKSRYRCSHCGFHSYALYWCCPSCQRWGMVKPKV